MSQMQRAATFAGPGHRTELARDWTAGGGAAAASLLFVLLNPSIADDAVDDPTIRRCIAFARREGFTRMEVMNLYSFRATKPADLWLAADPVGPENDGALRIRLGRAVELGEPVVAAWGAHAKPQRVAEVMALVPGVDWRALGFTMGGHPRHPLYVRGDAPLLEYRP